MQAVEISEQFEIEVKIPRTCGKQMNRANYQSESAEVYFRRRLYIPFIDHLILSLEDRFNPSSRRVCKINSFLATNIHHKTSKELKETVRELELIYKDDLDLVHSNLLQEVEIWKIRWSQNVELRPNSIIENLKVCDSSLYPGLHLILKIFCVLPVTTCECERDMSALKREKTSFRSTMTEERLNSISLIHIHKKRKIDVERVVDIFMSKPHRFN